jgi:hypothetical protein
MVTAKPLQQNAAVVLQRLPKMAHRLQRFTKSVGSCCCRRTSSMIFFSRGQKISGRLVPWNSESLGALHRCSQSTRPIAQLANPDG